MILRGNLLRHQQHICVSCAINRTTITRRLRAQHSSKASTPPLGGKRKRNEGVITLPTPSPYIWTVQGMTPGLLIANQNVKSMAKTMFSAKAAYIPPARMGYALPTQGKNVEVAFLGRSNVGKSSLVGAVLGNQKLVRVSKTPGCTQTINFYELQGQKLHVVDLPGYGFANAPEKARHNWVSTTAEYCQVRGVEFLRRVMLLIDARRGVTHLDEAAMHLLDDEGTSYQLVLTKIDMLPQVAQQRVIQQALTHACRKEHLPCFPALHLTSSKDGLGITELRETLTAVAMGV